MNGILETDAAPDGDIPRRRGKPPDCPTILTSSLPRAIARASVARSPNRLPFLWPVASGRLADNPGSQMRSRKLEVFP